MVKRYWYLALLTMLVLGVFAYYWPNATQTQAVGAIASFLGTVLLIGITLEYVRTNQDTLKLFKAQWKEQRRIVLRFGVKQSNGHARVWVANLGYSHFMIQKADILRQGSAEPVTLYKHMIVRPGQVRGFDLPEKVWRDAALMRDIDVNLSYESFGEPAVSESRSYHLLVSGGRVVNVRKGIHGLWGVSCPKCGLHQGMCMLTGGLSSFQEAAGRQSELESELKATCPEHRSQWLLTMQNVKQDHGTEPFE